MPLHLIKLCVGCASPGELRAFQQGKLQAASPLIHRTRHMPRRRVEVLDGGSLYWVFQGAIRARQKILDLASGSDEEGRGFCTIHFEPILIDTRLKRHRPFQGWRYLEAEKAPPDRNASDPDETDLDPQALIDELKRLGLA